MATRGEIKAKIVRLINKTANYQGFFTDDKCNDMIADSLDYLSLMAGLQGGGWFNGIQTIAMPAAGFTAPIPANVAIINQVRYLINNTYVPLTYHDADGYSQVDSTTSEVSYPTHFRIMGRDIYFNPAPSERGADRIQIEFTKYPAALANDAAILDGEFDNALQHYVKWRVASQLMSTAGRADADWTRFEIEWRTNCMNYISKRSRATTYIKNFGD
jgi:hypothetical protein